MLVLIIIINVIIIIIFSLKNRKIQEKKTGSIMC